MSEETQQVETQEAEASLVNVLQNDQEDTQAEAPIAIHDDPEPQDVADDDEIFERPDYYPEKFWDEEWARC